MKNVRSFGDWLDKKMKEQGYNKSSLQRATGVDRAHIRRMIEGEVTLPEEDTRQKFHDQFGTSDDELVELGIMARREYPRPDGTVHVEFVALKPSPASDMGERQRVAQIVEGMPDEAVQHLRRFLESVTESR